MNQPSSMELRDAFSKYRYVLEGEMRVPDGPVLGYQNLAPGERIDVSLIAADRPVLLTAVFTIKSIRREKAGNIGEDIKNAALASHIANISLYHAQDKATLKIIELDPESVKYAHAVPLRIQENQDAPEAEKLALTPEYFM